MCTASWGVVLENWGPSVPVIMLLELSLREMDSTSSSLTVARVAWEAVRRRSLSLPVVLLVLEAVLFVVALETCLAC